MPGNFRLPKDENECAIWKAAIATDKGSVSINGVNASLKHKLKQHFFVAENELKCLKTQKKVLLENQIAGVLKQNHDNSGHPSRDPTTAKIREIYASVPTKAVITHIQNCTVCKQRKVLPKAPVGKPIKSHGIWSRVGIDLIDMSSISDGEFRWIYHAKDHLSKMSWAVPLKNKTCKEVTTATRLMLYQFGQCKYLQHDCGGEFTGTVLLVTYLKV